MPKYQNPFEVGSGAQQHLSLNTQNILEQKRLDNQLQNQAQDIELVGGQTDEIAPYNSRARKWKLGTIPKDNMNKISQYRTKYEQFLKLHNNSSQKEVWNIYDHIANDLMKEQLEEVINRMVTSDLDQYLE